MKTHTKIFLLLFAVSLLVVSVSAIELNSGEIQETNESKVMLDSGSVVFYDTASGSEITSQIKIDGSLFIPSNEYQSGENLTWTTGEKDYFIFDNPTVKMEYSYTGNGLKEMITTKERKQFDFPVVLKPGYTLVPVDDGSFKVVKESIDDYYTGITILKPYGTDANGNYIEMNYSFSGGELHLNYDDVAIHTEYKTVVVPERNATQEECDLFYGSEKNITLDTIIPTSQYVEKIRTYVPISYPIVIDPSYTAGNDANTKYLLHFDTTTLTTDSAAGATHTWSTGGSPTRSTSTKVFGDSAISAYNSNYIYTAANTTDFDFTGDFTVDVFIDTSSQGAFDSVFGEWSVGTYGFEVDFGSGGGTTPRLVFDDGGTTRVVTATSSLAAGSWQHLAIVGQSGGAITMYINGTSVGSYATHNIRVPSSGKLFAIGAYYDATTLQEPLTNQAYFDEFRISNVARWTSNFAVPTVGYGYMIKPSGTFTPTGTTSGNPPLEVQFTETGDLGTSWKWNATNVTGNNVPFTFNSTSGSPKYTFGYYGNYSIVMISTNDAGTTTSTQVTWINVTPPAPPVASFTQNVTEGVDPVTVQFTDTSSGGATQWEWTYNAGTPTVFSTIQNPSRLFNALGYPFTNYSITLNATSGIGSNISTQKAWVNVTSNSSVTAAFSANQTTGDYPFPVLFTSTSTNNFAYIDSYYWEFGDGNTSTLQNPTNVYLPPPGLKDVKLRVTNTSTGLTDWENKTAYINVTIPILNKLFPSFSSNVTSGRYSFAVRFVDTSTTFNSTIDSWSWDFGDTGSSVLQNPEHTYTTAGTFDVSLTVSDTSLGISNTSAITTITSSPPTGVVRKNKYLSPQHTLTVTFKDADTGSIIPGVIVTDSLGNEQNVTLGTFSQTYDYSLVTIHYIAIGYASGSRTYSMTEDRTVVIELTPTGVTSSQTVWWTPHTVQITLMDSVYQNRLTGIPVNVSFNESAIPDEWLTQMYGIKDETAQQMLDRNLYLTGITGSDGTLTTTLLGSLKYDFHLDLSSRGGSADYFLSSYAQDSMLNIYVPIAGLSFPGITNTNQTQRLMVSNVTEPNLSYVTMWNYYQDPTGMTSQVNMDWRFANNNTVIQWVNTSNPGASLIIGNYTMQNTRGTQIWWGINATVNE